MSSHLVVRKAVVIARDADERALFVELLSELDLEAVVETVIPSGASDPAVVLTDLGSRYDMDTARAGVRRLRERWPRAPIIVLTAHRSAALDPDQLGADALLLKPFDVDDFTDAVHTVIARSGTHELARRLPLEA